MRSRYRGLVVLGVALAAAGCTTAAKHQEQLGAAAERQMTLGIVQKEIYAGLTQDEVIAALGSPNIVTRDAQGHETWVYDKVASEASYSSSGVYGNAVIELGLITATKEVDLAPGRYADNIDVGVFGWQPAPAFAKVEVNDFTGNVTELDQQTRIRVSFQRKVLDNYGQIIDVRAIDDPLFYRDFFSRVDKSVYLQKEHL